MDYWYHYAIMFEALFILTTIDTGTRVARFLVQEFFGRFSKKWSEPDWLPASILSTSIVVFAWAGLIWTGNISTIWPMFGIANQLLAAIALVIGTTLIFHWGRGQYAWVTIAPLLFVTITTTTAAVQSIFYNFLPLIERGQPVTGVLNTAVTILMLGSLATILTIGVRKWRTI